MDADMIAKKKKEAMAKKQEEAAQKKAAKEAEKAEKEAASAEAAESKARADAEATTLGLDVEWNVEGVGVDIDIWKQKEAVTVAPKPILWLHGGGWKFGTHHRMPAFLRKFIEAGFAVVSVGYRKSGLAKYPACLIDCKTVIRWLRSTETHGLDATSITVIGNSAGGHLAALLGLTVGIESLEGESFSGASSNVDGIVSMAGVYDLNGTCTDRESGKTPEAILLGGALDSLEEEVISLANPIQQVGKGGSPPPMLLFHGDEDEEVPYEQSQAFLGALKGPGVAVSLVPIPASRHHTYGAIANVQPEVEREQVKEAWQAALGARTLAFFRAIHPSPPNV